ncbi:MAG: nucleotide pyrophosphohydrolase, partial [Planctomycetaceae bacterium]
VGHNGMSSEDWQQSSLPVLPALQRDVSQHFGFEAGGRNGMSDLQQITEEIRRFRDERDWMQFHNPKNLAVSICLESAELLEHFQWATPEQSEAAGRNRRDQISAEIADVAIYLIELSDNLGIDLWQAIRAKLQHNAAKYPVEKARGNSLKYTELQ